MNPRNAAVVAVAALLSAGLSIALSTQSRPMVELEERTLAFALDFAHRGPQPEPVIVAWERAPDHGELAREVSALLHAQPAAVAVLVPVDEGAQPQPAAPASATPPGSQAPSPEVDDALAVALRGSKKVAVMVRTSGDKLLLPPARLVAQLPLGYREHDLARKGPLARRLVHDFAGTPLQSMAAATLLATRGRGETEIDEDSVGRLPFDRSTWKPLLLAAGAWKEGAVQGRIALLCGRADEARETAQSLAALLRIGRVVKLGAPDIAFILILALLGASAGMGMRGRFAAMVGVLLAVVALAAAFAMAGRGRPVLILAPVLTILFATGALALARLANFRAQRAALRRLLARQTSDEVATDLVADPTALLPERRRAAVLVADLVERAGTVVGQPSQVVMDVEAHERRVLAAVRHYGGIIDRFGGDRVVAMFGVSGAGATLPDAASLLAAQAALEIARSGGPTVAVGLDTGEVLCGFFGVERRYRVQGEVVRRATRAARAAASQGIAVAATEQVCRDVEPKIASHPMATNADIRLFELHTERPTAVREFVDRAQ